MDTMTIPMSSPKTLKRNCSEAGLDGTLLSNMNDSMSTGAQGIVGSPPNVGATFEPISSSASGPCAPSTDVQPLTSIKASATEGHSALEPNRKRAKLTTSEREAKSREKEAKEKERAEQKAKKEEERIQKEREREEDKSRKDREKQARLAEKEKKRQEREEQSKLKEEEKRKREEEKDKKMKSQLRLNAFFPRPNLNPDGSMPSPTHESPSPVNSRRSSITSLNGPDGFLRDRSLPATPSKSKRCDYDSFFPSFFLQSFTTLAPLNRFERDEEGLHCACSNLDKELASAIASTRVPSFFNPKEMLRVSPHKRRKLNKPQLSVRDIVAQLNGTSNNPIDLTNPRTLATYCEPMNLLRSISTKILKFAEDVRPPYIGTYTRVQSPSTARKICRNPFSRDLPRVDYDYDSEAEWEDPGEGEDLDSEAEEEVESENGDDMDGFLDDEDLVDGTKASQKRRVLTSDLEPTSTGLCWEDPDGHPALADLAHYRLEVILDKPRMPIDPYSSTYWLDSVSTAVPIPSTSTSHSIMDPPRIPLNTTNRANLLIPNPAATTGDLLKPPLPSKASSQAPKRMVASEVLDDFKRAIEGSDLTKAGLVEVLKKQFPKQSKDAIKDTIGVVAERVGRKENDKRWVIKNSGGL